MLPVVFKIVTPLPYKSVESDELSNLLKNLYDLRILELRPFNEESECHTFKILDHSLHPYPIRVLVSLKNEKPDIRSKRVEWMRWADLMQLGPKFLKASENQQYAVLNKIESKYPPLDLRDFAGTLKTLHSLPPPYFVHPKAKSSTFDQHEKDLELIHRKMELPVSVIEFHQKMKIIEWMHSQIESQSCVCHLNLHGDNLLNEYGFLKFTGWTRAGMDDPFIELALAAMLLFLDEEKLLSFYFDGDVSEAQRTHYELVRPLRYSHFVLWGLMQAIDCDLEKTAEIYDSLWEIKDFPPFENYLTNLTAEGYSPDLKTAEEWVKFSLSALYAFYQ